MKQLKDTKIGKFLAEKAPDVLDVAGSLLPDAGLLGVVKNLIDKDPNLSQEDKQQIHEQLVEFYKLEVQDRDSARQREVEMVKAGSEDWMMNFTGVVGLGAKKDEREESLYTKQIEVLTNKITQLETKIELLIEENIQLRVKVVKMEARLINSAKKKVNRKNNEKSK